MSNTQCHWRDTLTLRRSPRARYVRFRVHPWGAVEVVVPQRFDERRLPALIAQQEPWVERTLARLAAVRPLQPMTAEPPREIHLPAIDGYWPIEYLPDAGERHGCRERYDGVLTVAADEGWREALIRWLARMGREHLVAWLGRVSEETGLLFSGVSVRGQKSRWGSCSVSGHININYALLFLEPHLVRHLFVHELCHTVHHNHSAAFWALVARHTADYRRHERELKAAGSLLPLWYHQR